MNPFKLFQNSLPPTTHITILLQLKLICRNFSRYKTQSSLRSDSVTPSPTGYGSDHTPEPSQAQSPDTSRGVVWAVTDMASVPKGSVLIDPHTLQPIVNQDG